jgi:uncharacterized protein (TIGR02453 family)
MAFRGWPTEALDFYEGLEADNSRAYWTDHAEAYERAVRGPMLALIAAVEPEFGPVKFFRPQRDLRFSADKTPYKTHAGAVTRGEGAHSHYVQISAAGLLVAGGSYRMSKDQLDRYRAAVADERAGRALAKVVEGLLAEGFTLHGEELKRAPRGFDPAHPRADLLRRKGLAAFRDHGTPDWLGTAECLDAVVTTWRRITPLGEWLGRHVGPPEPVEGDPRTRARR